MRSKLRLRAVLPVAVLALGGAGFGAFVLGGPPPEEPPLPIPKHALAKKSAKPPTLAAWLEATNQLCREAERTLGALDEPETPEEVAAVLTESVEVGRKLIRDVRAGALPRRAAPEIRSLVASWKKVNGAQLAALGAMQRQDLGAFARAADRVVSLGTAADGKARALGLRGCAAAKKSKPKSALERELLEKPVIVVVLYAPGSAVDSLAILEARAGAEAVDAGFIAIDVSDEGSIEKLAKRYPIREAPAVLVVARWRGAVTVINGYADRELVAQAASNARV